jgi:protease-4
MKRAVLIRTGILGALALVLLFLVLRGTPGPEIADGSTAILEISGGYIEGPSSPLLSRLSGRGKAPFVGLLSSLAMLERDDRIATVVVHVKSLQIGWGKAEEVRAAIQRLRAAGRKTIAFLEVASFSPNVEYFVASGAEEIYVPPGASLPMLGLAAEHLYLGGLFEKLGVEIEVAKVGKFKSAAESIAEKQMSEPARLQANALLDSTFEHFVAGIAEGRGLTVEQVERAIDAGPVQIAELRELGFLNGAKQLLELTDEIGAPVVSSDDYRGVTAEEVGFDPVAEFALIYGSGNVVSGRGSSSPTSDPVFASETVSEALLDAADDPRFDALILRIDSPGGSALASEMVAAAIDRVRESGKPIIASFSDVAASGGYYVAAGADAIVAPALSITGSIGVFALRPVIGDLLDQVGIGVEPFTRGKHADFYLSAKPLSPGASARLQSLVEETYELFISRVAQGRGMTRESVMEVAQGRVWSGAQAHEIGLVDELGGLRSAVTRARLAVGLAEDADVALVPYPGAPTLADQLRELVGVELGSWLRASPLMVLVDAAAPPSRALQRLAAFVDAMPINQPLALAPALPDIR